MDIPLADDSGYVDQRSICNVAQAFVEEKHPEACASIFGGSAAAGTATSTSDLDIALLYPNGHSNYAQTTRYRGWLVETFVHTPESLQFWYRKEAQDRRPVIAALCASGLLLTDDGSGAAWQAGAQAEIARGPEPLTDQERNSRRYNLSALVDDLEGSESAAEDFMLTAEVLREAADLLLLENGNWLGAGKWVIRRLAQSDHDLAVRLLAWARGPKRDPQNLVALAKEVLGISGGYLQEGFVRGAL
ncbi:putative nucleotidyltransferase [Arthrobacter ulcerisalmonis]|nr:nucleotidyltransferase domain-containing protein [Arthrobacter ulcerisalmonis]MDQ0664513.1 putative nucleotidyltransferase [Arthrobacter ulcerisalmonis]